jgi:aminoglycoside phosphotransferase (APT) family kinase protein
MLGELIADGRTSEVFAFGNDSAAKVLKQNVPQHWAATEAELTESVRRLGVPAPEVRDLVEVDGRSAIVFERVAGPSMWQRMLDAPHDVGALSREMANVQRAIHSAGVPDRVPALVARLSSKLDEVIELSADERTEAHDLLLSLPRGAALLHGDLHPGNVLLGADGPVVIDWFDCAVGHPAADIVRSLLLIRVAGATDLRHLPGATRSIVDEVRATYSDELGWPPDGSDETIRSWERLVAAGRVAERTDSDASGLLAIWTGIGSSRDPNIPDLDIRDLDIRDLDIRDLDIRDLDIRDLDITDRR